MQYIESSPGYKHQPSVILMGGPLYISVKKLISGKIINLKLWSFWSSSLAPKLHRMLLMLFTFYREKYFARVYYNSFLPHISAIPSRLFLIFCAILHIEKTNENMLISFTNASHGFPTRLRREPSLALSRLWGSFWAVTRVESSVHASAWSSQVLSSWGVPVVLYLWKVVCSPGGGLLMVSVG